MHEPRVFGLFAGAVLGAMVFGLPGCAPTLDWRDVRIAGTAVVAQFPCRVSSYERRVDLAGVPVVMGLQACRAGEVTWAVAHADVVDPARVGPALQALRQAAQANVSGAVESVSPWTGAGFTPNADAVQQTIRGQLPGQGTVTSRVAVFAVGTTVFQASAIASSETVETADFFASIRVVPQ